MIEVIGLDKPLKTLTIRVDSWGSGHYLAPRGNGRKHKGVDYVVKIGEEVFSPITGFLVRAADPYGDGQFSGLLLRNNYIEIKMFYMTPIKELIGKKVLAGQGVGYAQNVSDKYTNMVPHLHVEIPGISPDFLLRGDSNGNSY